MELELQINGLVESLEVVANESLLALLRRKGYCSVKQGCETGECGACTVLVDGVPRPGCVMLAAQAGGCALTTAESLGTTRSLHPLQEAFIEAGAVQCGFCTPGMLLSVSALLKRNANPTEDDVRDALSGNLCRCTGYAKPVQAVLRAAALLRGETADAVQYGEHESLPVVGKSVRDIDAIKRVTGRAAFADDFALHGMLYGRLLPSPHAHAVIRHIDVSQARALPGVHAVLTYQDVPRVPYGSGQTSGPHDQYSLDYSVRYVGDRVAAVAAETPELAEQAIQLIKVEYDVLPSLLDLRQALEPSAPLLHSEAESYGIYDAAHNVAARVQVEQGNVERGFAEADIVVEGEYIVPSLQQTPLENHTVITYFDEDDYLVVRTSTQVPHRIRQALAPLLNLPARRIRVVQPNIGGGFGVKQELVLEDLCALLTLASNRPVRLAYTRADELRSSRIQPPHIVRMKTGVKRDGTLVANQMVVLASTGAYATHPLAVSKQAAASALPLYPCPHMRFVAEVVYTNVPPASVACSTAALPEFFALESHMDEIAKHLDMDSVELRRKNWIHAGESYPLAQNSKKSEAVPLESSGLAECVQVLEEKLGWKEKRDRDIPSEANVVQREDESQTRFRRGIGMALSLYGAAAEDTAISGASVKLNEDGSFDVFASVADGGIGLSTLLTQIAAEALDVPVEDILLHTSGTEVTPFDTSAGAASTLYASGNAVKKAAEQVRRQLLSIAERMLDGDAETLKMHRGVITAPAGQTVTLAQVAAQTLMREGQHIIATASWKEANTPTSFAAQGAEVEVDTETGMVRVLKVIAAVDAGRVLNQQIEEAQVQGSVTQALGIGISEEMLYNQNGQLLTLNLGDYRVYNAPDMPEMQTQLVETESSSGPFGAKSVVEAPLYGMPPAIANAVADAVGVRIRHLPLTPERVLRALHAQDAKQSLPV